MSRFPSSSLQQKLFTYGIIPTICFSLGFSSLPAAESTKKGSLVILDGRPQGRIPEGSNLQEKVQFLTKLTSEQAERIHNLRQEIDHLKNKLHLTHLTVFSDETGNYKQLYAALKNESAQNKETQKQLETIISQLKEEKEAEWNKNAEAKAQIIALMSALESQSLVIEKIEEKYKHEFANLKHFTQQDEEYKKLYQELVQESKQYQETQIKLEKLIQELKGENLSEKQKLLEAENHIASLMAALNEQTLTLESIQEKHQKHLQQSTSTIEDRENYKAINAQLIQELTQTKETHQQLESLISRLKDENELEKQKISDAESHITTLMTALTEQTQAHEALKENHQNAIDQLTLALSQSQSQNLLQSSLAEELLHSKDSHDRLELLVKKLHEENEAAKDKIREAEKEIATLQNTLIEQTISLEKLQGNQEQEKLALNDNNKNLTNELKQAKKEQEHLEGLVQQLKEDHQQEMLKLIEAEAYIASLMDTLAEQTQATSNIQETHARTVSKLDLATEEFKHIQDQNTHLTKELSEAKKAQNELENLIDQIKTKYSSEQKINKENETHLSALITLVDTQILTLEKISENYQESQKNESFQLDTLQQEKEDLLSQLYTLNHEKESLLIELEASLTNENQKKLSLQEEEFNKKYQELVQFYENNYKQELSSTGAIYAALEAEHLRNDTVVNTLKNTMTQLEKNLEHAQAELQHLQQEHALNLQHIANIQLSNADKIINELNIQILENQKSALKDSNQSAHLAQLMNALETAYIQHGSIQEEKNENIKNLLNDLTDEKFKAIAIQRNMDEFQQMYDQTVKLYNELYVDHSNTQKDLHSLQEGMDELRLHHLGEIEDYKIHLENLATRFKNEIDQSQSLKNQLSAAIAEINSLRHLEQQNAQLQQESEQIKMAYVSYIESIALHEDLLNQSYNHLAHQKKVIEEQSNILQDVYKDKFSLLSQLEAYPLTIDQIVDLQSDQKLLKEELSNLTALHLEQIHAQAMQEDVNHGVRVELEHYKNLLKEQEEVVKQHLQDKESLGAVIAEKMDEVRQLTHQMERAEQNIKSQLQELSAHLENEKNRNVDLSKELAEVSQKSLVNQQNVQNIHEELEHLNESLTQKNHEISNHKKEIVDLNDQLKMLDQDKNSLTAQLKDLQEKQIAKTSDDNNERAQLEENLQELREILIHKDEALQAHRQTSKKLMEEQETLKEDHLKLLAEKNELEQEYQQGLIKEKELKSLLEQNLEELHAYKNTLDQYQKIQHDNAEVMSKLEKSQEENTILNKQMAYLTQQYELEKAKLEKEHISLKAQIDKYAMTKNENQELVEELNRLHQEKLNHKNNSQVSAIQVERLQEALQQTLNEKTSIQSQYQNQLITERILTEKLEQALAELEDFKNEHPSLKSKELAEENNHHQSK